MQMQTALLLLSLGALATRTTAKHLECLDPAPEPIPIDADWTGKVDEWHLTAGTPLHLHRTAAELAAISVDDLLPNDLYYHACPKFHWGDKATVTGFGDKEFDTGLTPNPDGTFSFRYKHLGLTGQATPVLTDNDDFIMFSVCWAEGREASFAVISDSAQLTAKDRRLVRRKAKELGFGKTQFTTLRFDSCGTDDDDDDDVKDEL